MSTFPDDYISMGLIDGSTFAIKDTQMNRTNLYDSDAEKFDLTLVTGVPVRITRAHITFISPNTLVSREAHRAFQKQIDAEVEDTY